MPLGIYILTESEFSYILGFVNQVEEYAKALLDETIIMKETLANKEGVKYAD
jgi:hypothetical protein